MQQKSQKKDRFPVLRERLNNLMGDMSTTDFAEKVGLTRQTMGFYLNGDRIPDSLTLVQICEKCNVSADWLLGLSDDRQREATAIDELGLSEAAVGNILYYANAHGFEDCLPGLNMLIEQGDILCIAALAYRFRAFVREARRIERSYSRGATDLSDATQQRNATNIAIIEGLEKEIFEKYPYLKGHFRVVAGARAVRDNKDDLVKSFDEAISRVTGYNSFMDEIAYRDSH